MFGHRYFGSRYFGPRYWGDGGDGTPPVVVVDTATPSGVRGPRFLRRSKRHELPWEREEVTDDVVVKSRRVSIPKMAIKRMEQAVAPIPVAKFQDLPAIEIRLPSVGVAKLEDDDEDDLLWLI